jgi:hypothetical protein
MTRRTKLLGGNQYFSPIDHPIVYSKLLDILSRLYAIRAMGKKNKKLASHDIQSFIWFMQDDLMFNMADSMLMLVTLTDVTMLYVDFKRSRNKALRDAVIQVHALVEALCQQHLRPEAMALARKYPVRVIRPTFESAIEEAEFFKKLGQKSKPTLGNTNL